MSCVKVKKLQSQVYNLTQPWDSFSATHAHEEEPMTLCIAATCQHENMPAIVLCSDSRAEHGIYLSELRVGSEDADKIRWIGDFSAMLSGLPTKADELLTQCDQAIREFSKTQPNVDSDIVITSFFEQLRKAARSRKRQIVEHHIAMSTAFNDYEDFISKAKSTLSESHYNRIWEEIRSLGLGAEVIIAGFHDDEAIIIKLDDAGEVHWEDHYSVIGTGSQMALSFLCQNDYEDTMSLQECLFRTLEAKKAAEKNRTVGHSTSFEVLIQGKGRFDITDAAFQVLKVFLRFSNIPTINLGDKFLEDLDDDENGDGDKTKPESSQGQGSPLESV